jgi:hypothetical protein
MDNSQVVKRSWKLMLTHKWLWVYGLVVSLFSGGSSNLNFPSGNSTPTQEQIKNLPDTSRQVLAATSDLFSSWAQQVSPLQWLLLGLSTLAVITVVTVITVVIHTWAKASLVKGVAMALSGQPTNLPTTSPTGRKVFPRLILLGLISILPTLGLFLLFSLICLVMFVFNIILGVITSLVLGLAFVVAVAVFATVGVFADRLVVLENFTPWQAWKTGLGYGWRNFYQVFLMAILNTTIGCAAGCLATLAAMLLLGLPFLLLAWPMFNNPSSIPSPSALIGIFVLTMLAGAGLLLFRVGLVLFTYSNWQQLYEHLVSSRPKST